MEPNQSDLPVMAGWPRERTSGGPATTPIPAQQPAAPLPWAGLPVLSGEASPHLAAAAAPPALLDVHAPTLTQQMRTMQPPDVARQAISELGVLARELDTLAEAV